MTDEFERLSWHDCSVWGLELRSGKHDGDDGISDLALDIDFIVEWLCGVDRSVRFRVAPATLVFHGVTGFRAQMESMDADGYQVALYPAPIDRIERRRIEDQKVYLDRPYYAWTVLLGIPVPGSIHFGAYGFTQTLRKEPVETELQTLTYRQRSA